MTDYDLEIFCKTLFGEVRGEPKEGQIAVANCIFNRFKSKKWYSSKTIAGVCLKPWQFSCWNKSDPNSQILAKLTYSQYSKFIPIIKEASQEDITNGATHYFNPHICKRPKWAEGKQPCCVIGLHEFYKEID